ncbi:UNVERIFIED_CONTAM: drug/metabolite transporter (DMT)-like permease [Brevibacillus sp. OAP136]
MTKWNKTEEHDLVKSSKYSVIIIALLSVYLFWGGTYLGIKVAVETMPPFIMAGFRFFVAGCVLYAIAHAQGHSRPSLTEWKNAGIVGALLLLGGNGAVAWAEQKVPSAIASLLVATVPLWILLFQSVGTNRLKPSKGVIAGMGLGFLGIAVLVLQPGGTGTRAMDTLGILALLLGSISWSAGSLFSRRATLPASPLMSTALQMIGGGILLAIASFFLDDWSSFHISAISLRSYLALAYLIVFGSIIAYTAYIWLLKNAEPTWVSTYAFVNPVVAVFLGWFAANEQLAPRAWVAAAIIIAAVVIITLFRSSKASADKKQPLSTADIGKSTSLPGRE